MDCILFCIFLLALHQNNSGASSPQKAEAPWLLRLLAGPLVQGCLLETSHWLHQRQIGVRFCGSLTPGITSSPMAAWACTRAGIFHSHSPMTLVTSNAPCMSDATPRACNVFETPCYKMVTWIVAGTTQLGLYREWNWLLEHVAGYVTEELLFEAICNNKSFKKYRRWSRKILEKYQEQRAVF